MPSDLIDHYGKPGGSLVSDWHAIERRLRMLERAGFRLPGQQLAQLAAEGGASGTIFDVLNGASQLVGTDLQGNVGAISPPAYSVVGADENGELGAAALPPHSMLVRTEFPTSGLADKLYGLIMPGPGTFMRTRGGVATPDSGIIWLSHGNLKRETNAPVSFEHTGNTTQLDNDGPYFYYVVGSDNQEEFFELPPAPTPGVGWFWFNDDAGGSTHQWSSSRKLTVDASGSSASINGLSSWSTTGNGKVGVAVVCISPTACVAFDWSRNN